MKKTHKQSTKDSKSTNFKFKTDENAILCHCTSPNCRTNTQKVNMSYCRECRAKLKI